MTPLVIPLPGISPKGVQKEFRVPTYAYVCTECGHSFEVVQAITDDAMSECPTCGGTLRKKFHPVGVAFKGSGFYRNDSRTGSSDSGSSGSGSSADTAAASSSKESSGGSTTKTSESSGSGSGSSGSSSSGSGSSNSGSSGSGSSGSSGSSSS